MPVDVYMPQLSPTMTEGRLARWTKNAGDKVAAGDIIAEVETDKATMEVEATDDGIIHKVIGEEGTDIPVGAPIAILKEDGEEVADDYQPTSKAVEAPKEESAPASAPAPSAAPAAAPAPLPVAAPAPAPAPVMQEASADGHTKASPLARRMAKEKGINLAAITGTGPKGRVVAADVAKKRAGFGAGQAASIARQGDTAEGLTPMRKAIAARLTESKQQIPHFYLQKSANMAGVLEMRQQLNTHAKEQGNSTKLTINDFFLKASAMALGDFPDANASWGGDRVIKYGNVDVSVAVAIEGGLITPIVFNADQKPLAAISNEVKALVKQAKAGTLKPEQYTGGSMSLSNLGMFGVETFSAIVNPPQAAILAVGGTQEVVVATEDGFGVQPRTNLTLSVDHRVIDGALAAEVLGRTVYYLENPVLLVA